jgi:hypothetical protein
MAGAGWRQFTVGQLLTSAQVQTFLQDQSVQVHASAAARSSALGTAVSEGMVSYRTDDKALELYAGSAWTPVMQGRNAVINGAFDFWQRGTSFTNATTYTADRWSCSRDGSTTINVTQQTFTPGTAPVAGYEAQYFMRIASTVVSAATFYAGYKVEDVRSFAGQTVTLSYWAKANTPVSNTPLYVQNFGTGGSSAVVVANLATHSITTSWQRFSVTFTLGSIAGKTIGTNNCLELQVIRSATTANVDIWGVQLEAGSVATPFQRNAENLQGELAACQRYYEKSFDPETAPSNGPNTTSFLTTRGLLGGVSLNVGDSLSVPFKVSKRAVPTITLFGNSNGHFGYTTTSAGLTFNANAWGVGNIGVSSFTGQQGVVNNTLVVVQGHWVASAEL